MLMIRTAAYMMWFFHNKTSYFLPFIYTRAPTIIKLPGRNRELSILITIFLKGGFPLFYFPSTHITTQSPTHERRRTWHQALLMYTPNLLNSWFVARGKYECTNENIRMETFEVEKGFSEFSEFITIYYQHAHGFMKAWTEFMKTGRWLMNILCFLLGTSVCFLLFNFSSISLSINLPVCIQGNGT